MSLLGVAYVAALKEEEKQERVNKLKTKVFLYAVSHHMLYHEVVRKIENKELSLEEIDNGQQEKTFFNARIQHCCI